jgi:uncharacterized iron-regulated membrane protein
MGVRAPAADTARVIRPNTGTIVEYVIVIFLLFFAVLAFAWFYLQRAKARDAATATPDVAPAAAAPVETAPAASAPTESEATRTDQPAS